MAGLEGERRMQIDEGLAREEEMVAGYEAVREASDVARDAVLAVARQLTVPLGALEGVVLGSYVALAQETTRSIGDTCGNIQGLYTQANELLVPALTGTNNINGQEVLALLADQEGEPAAVAAPAQQAHEMLGGLTIERTSSVYLEDIVNLIHRCGNLALQAQEGAGLIVENGQLYLSS